MTKQEFTYGVENWNNHLWLLWPALEATNGLVVEFGIGHGSTPYLSGYCESRHRELRSYENNEEWYNKIKNNHPHKFIKVGDWENIAPFACDVLLIDHAPGERRKEDIKKFAGYTQIIVAHDTEPAADHGYQMRAELAKFKYQVDYQSPGAWASIVSNFIDVKKVCGFA